MEFQGCFGEVPCMKAFHDDSWLIERKEGTKHRPALKHSGLELSQ